MKKLLIVMLAMVLALAVLAGCGDGNVGNGGGTDLSAIEQRLSDLETQNQQQADKISGLEAQNQQQADKISGLETQNQQQADKISDLEAQNQQQAGKISGLESQNRELQADIDRANYKYDWENPIDIDLTAFVNLYNTNKDEFINTYFNKVVRFSGSISSVVAFGLILDSYSAIVNGTAMRVIFLNYNEAYIQSLVSVTKIFVAAYNRVESRLYLYDCRVVA